MLWACAISLILRISAGGARAFSEEEEEEEDPFVCDVSGALISMIKDGRCMSLVQCCRMLWLIFSFTLSNYTPNDCRDKYDTYIQSSHRIQTLDTPSDTMT